MNFLAFCLDISFSLAFQIFLYFGVFQVCFIFLNVYRVILVNISGRLLDHLAILVPIPGVEVLVIGGSFLLFVRVEL